MEIEELDLTTKLNIKSQLADAKLGVAEELSWPLAGFAATAAHLAFGSWLLNFALFAGTYYLATDKFRKDSATAEDKYNQAAGLGKYYKAAPGPGST